MNSCFLQDHLQESLLDALIEEERDASTSSSSTLMSAPKRSELLRREMVRRCSFLIQVVTYVILRKHSYNKALRKDELEMKCFLALNDAGKHYIPNPNSSFETYAYKFMYLTAENYAETMEMETRKKEEFIENINDEESDGLAVRESDVDKVEDFERKRLSLKLLKECFSHLTKTQAFVVVHFYALFNREKLTVKEMASQLGLSVGKVSGILLKAKRSIKECQKGMMGTLKQLKLF